MSVDTAIPLGLITAELLINAYKYAFPAGSSGAIRIELALRSSIVELTVADDGVGLKKGEPSPGSTGFRLVRALAEKIGGRFSTHSARGCAAPSSSPSRSAPNGRQGHRRSAPANAAAACRESATKLAAAR